MDTEYRSILPKQGWTLLFWCHFYWRCSTPILMLIFSACVCRRHCWVATGSQCVWSCPSHVPTRNLDRDFRSRRDQCRRLGGVWPCFLLRAQWIAEKERRRHRRRGWGLVGTSSSISGVGSWSKPHRLWVRSCKAGHCKHRWSGRWSDVLGFQLA